MQSSQAHISQAVTPALPQVAIAAVHTPDAPPLPSPCAQPWRAATLRRAEESAAPAQTARCSERGCVFPAVRGKEGKCLHHLRQSHEPVLFSSYQPTRAVLDRGRFELPSEEVDTSRNRDRRQLVAMREAFLED